MAHSHAMDDAVALPILPPEPGSEEAPKLERRITRLRSPYDLPASDKTTRALRARVRAEADAESALLEGMEIVRPKTRKDCLPGGVNAMRPCPFVGCKHHLFLEVNKETGSIQTNFPDQEPWQLEETCSLDVADREHGITLEKVGALMQRTRERVRQIETGALEKLRRHLPIVDEEE